MSEHDDPTLSVARDLSEILRLDADLETAATHDGVDSAAMVQLAPVANLEAWEHLIEHAEIHGLDTTHVSDHDDEWEPALQSLLFWSEQWRVEHGREMDGRPTIGSEVAFLRSVLQWAYDNEPRWDDYAESVRTARVRLENDLRAGVRAQRGVPCLTCGTTLVREANDRKPVPHVCPGHDDGVCPVPHTRLGCVDRGGLRDVYRCPNHACGVTTVTLEEYRLAVGNTHLAHADRLTAADIERRTGIKASVVRVWGSRGQVAKRGKNAQGITLYDVAQAEERHAQKQEVA